MKKTHNFPFEDEYEKLELLISQGQFELLSPKSDSQNKIRLIYLMNDAVESFLVFHEAKLTGLYQPDFQGEIDGTLEEYEQQYVLIIHQGKQVCTLFFQNLTLETHLFNYGKTGHFWVKGYEYLRLLEYRIAILRDKQEYLGKDFCTEEEQKLSCLAEFPPLNFCCYPAVPDKYLVPAYPWWSVSEEALQEMMTLALEAEDRSLILWLTLYAKFPHKIIARLIAHLLHTVKHADVVDLIEQKLSQAASTYPNRIFQQPEEKQIQHLKEKVNLRKSELEQSEKRVDLLKEEPFLYAKDSVEYKLHLMIWKEKGKNRQVDVETFCTK